MQGDNSLNKMASMQYKRMCIISFKEQKLTTRVTYTDGKDDYEMEMFCDIIGTRIQVNKYGIAKGSMIGF